MTRRAWWFTSMPPVIGVAVFVAGFVGGWETLEPAALPDDLAGSGAFGGVVTTSWGWEPDWLSLVAIVVVVGALVLAVRVRRARRPIIGTLLGLLGLSMIGECAQWVADTDGADLGFVVNPWTWGTSVAGASLTLLSGVVLCATSRREP